MRDDLAYFLSLIDDSIRVIQDDLFCENLVLKDYEIKDEELLKDSALEDYINCHSCTMWKNKEEMQSLGFGVKNPLVAFVFDKVYENKQFFSSLEEKKYFASWLKAIKLNMKNEIYLTAKCKCPHAISCNEDILLKELEELDTKVIIFLTSTTITKVNNAKLLAINSVKEVLDNPNLKRDVWNKLKQAAVIAGFEAR